MAAPAQEIMRILLVEDDEPIAEAVRRGLEDARYEVDLVADGLTGLDRARTGVHAAIILDIMLPKMDGWEVCRQLRAERVRTPILMLTARDSLEDRVRGLELGADDYLPKPFAFPELLARLRALLRREGSQRNRILRTEDLEIDRVAGRVTRGGREIRLTRRQYSLLEALALRPGRVLTREYILDFVWQNEDSYSNTVDVYIAQLRKKIDSDCRIKLIQTVPRLGYTLSPRESEATDEA